MVSITYIQDTSAAAITQTPTVIEKVNAVTAVQSLPQDGKKLPQDNHKQAESKAGLESSIENIEQAVQTMNDHVQVVKRQLEFHVDETSGRTVITVLDKDTQEVIRQIPNEEALNFVRKLQQGDELEIFSKFV